MVYPYAVLSDTTEVVHLEMGQDGRVKVYIEKAVYDGFHSAVCYLPDYTWEKIVGFSDVSGLFPVTEGDRIKL